MKHHRADEEDEQRPILEQCVRPNGSAVLAAFLRAPRPPVIDLIGTDDEQGEDGRERKDEHEEEDAAIGNEVTKQAHRHRKGGQQRPYRKCNDPRGNQSAFGSQAVDQGARRGLSQDPGDPAGHERDPDALFVPPIASEVNREEWSDSRLDVGEEEI
jgi:hypothetical protein